MTPTLANHSPALEPLPRSGDLGDVDVVQMLRLLHSRKPTGTLVLESPRSGRRTLYFMSGDIVAATTDVEDLRLGRSLYRTGLINRAQLNEALQAATNDHPLGEVLLEKGFISAELRQEGLTLQFREILFSSFLLREGSYTFNAQDAIFADNLQLFFDTDELIDEGVRLMEEIAILSRELEREDHIYQRVGMRPSLPLRREQEELLRHIDGRRSTAELFVLSPLERLPTIQLLSQLLEQGLIRKLGACPRLSPEELPTYPLLPEEVYPPPGTTLDDLLPPHAMDARKTSEEVIQALSVEIDPLEAETVETATAPAGAGEPAELEHSESFQYEPEAQEPYHPGESLEHERSFQEEESAHAQSAASPDPDDSLDSPQPSQPDPNEGVFTSAHSVLDVVDLSHVRQYGVAVDIPLDGIVETMGAEDYEHHMEAGDEDEEEEEYEDSVHAIESGEDEDSQTGLEVEDGDEHGGYLDHEDPDAVDFNHEVDNQDFDQELEDHEFDHEHTGEVGFESEMGLEAVLTSDQDEDDDLDPAEREPTQSSASWGMAESLLAADVLRRAAGPADMDFGGDETDYESLPPNTVIEGGLPHPEEEADEDFEELRQEDVAAAHDDEEPISLEEALFPAPQPLWEPPPAQDDDLSDDEDVHELQNEAIEPHDEPEELDDVVTRRVSMRPGEPPIYLVEPERPLLDSPVSLKELEAATEALPPAADEISQEEMAVLESIADIFKPLTEGTTGIPSPSTRRSRRGDNGRGSSTLSATQRALLKQRAEIYNQIFHMIFTNFSRKLGRDWTRQRFQDFFTPGHTTYPELFIDLTFRPDGTIEPDSILANLEAYPTQRPAEVFDASLNELFYFLLHDIHQILEPTEQSQMMQAIVQVRNLLFKRAAAAK